MVVVAGAMGVTAVSASDSEGEWRGIAREAVESRKARVRNLRDGIVADIRANGVRVCSQERYF
jgi:hypothetical protein